MSVSGKSDLLACVVARMCQTFLELTCQLKEVTADSLRGVMDHFFRH